MPRYRTTLRPAAGGGLPMGVTWRFVELPCDGSVTFSRFPDLLVSRHHYGVVELDRELTPRELRQFGIEPVEA